MGGPCPPRPVLDGARVGATSHALQQRRANVQRERPEGSRDGHALGEAREPSQPRVLLSLRAIQGGGVRHPACRDCPAGEPALFLHMSRDRYGGL